MATSSTIGADLAPEVGVGGIQSLKDLSDYTKLANPADTAGLTGGVYGLSSKLSDLGAGKLSNAAAAPGFFSSIQKASTPLTDTAHPSLGGLMSDLQPKLDAMTGSGSGPKGLPSMKDFVQHVGGGPDVTAFNSSDIDVVSITAFNSSITKAQNLFATAGVDLSSPSPNCLGSSMAFATNLHKFGADKSGSGIADMLHGMADTSTKYGESIRASLVEGNNNNILSVNGMPPIKTDPFAGLPTYTGEDSSLNTNAGAKLLGGN